MLQKYEKKQHQLTIGSIKIRADSHLRSALNVYFCEHQCVLIAFKGE